MRGLLQASRALEDVTFADTSIPRTGCGLLGIEGPAVRVPVALVRRRRPGGALTDRNDFPRTWTRALSPGRLVAACPLLRQH